ncbi:MAG: DNA starvation/stationary phase protection protein [Chloroflexi bacterium]|nr:DNA starvation/stationary phase protection protein [Chloroflexota bacterium]
MASRTKKTLPSTVATMAPALGLDDKAREGVVDVLQGVLADSHVLYIKLRKYHWNVTGPEFHALHQLFEQQYTALADSIDETAERIVQYGVSAIGSMKAFVELSSLKEDATDGLQLSATTMVERIVADHEAVVRKLRDDIETVGEEYGDVAAEDYLTGLMQAHQKFAWMTRAMIRGA